MRVPLTGLSLAACRPPAQTVVAVTAGMPQVIAQVVTATPSPATDTPAPPVLMPAPTWRPLGKRADLKNDQGPVYSQGWSPDGKHVSTGSGAYEQLSPGTVIVWSTSSLKN